MSKAAVTKDAVLAALSKVQEPELHRDLVTLNMVRDLTIDRILVTPERADTVNGAIGVCDCGGSDGCLASDGGRPPDYVRLSIDGGYSFQPHIPFRTLDPILLRPHVRVPFGGL